MKELIELSLKIKDKELREKVVAFIKNPQPANKDFKKYPKEKYEDAGAPFNAGEGSVERDLIKHTVTLTELCFETAKSLEKNFGLKINSDYLVAAAILHDIMKIYEWKRTKGGLEHTGVMLDHSFLGVAELYHRDFPEEVIHIVASHIGENGPTPPRSYEALILHYLDSMLSLTEYHYLGKKAQEESRIMLFDEETLKKLIGEKTEKESK
ncbi:MAG: HDIG domain-containing metalloprotein [Candidatus Aenigmatarchaeota archaeon]